MIRVSVLMLVIASRTLAFGEVPNQPERPLPTRVPKRGCLDPRSKGNDGNVEVTARSKSADARKSALQAIKPIVLGRHERVIGEGLQEGSRHELHGAVATTTIGGITGRFVVGPTGWSGDAVPIDRAWQFGIVGGKVVRLVAKPNVVSVTTLVRCGCERPTCASGGMGCTACGETSQTVFGPLPDGMEYAGEHVVSYSDHVVRIEYQQTTGCPSPRRCPQPP